MMRRVVAVVLVVCLGTAVEAKGNYGANGAPDNPPPPPPYGGGPAPGPDTSTGAPSPDYTDAPLPDYPTEATDYGASTEGPFPDYGTDAPTTAVTDFPGGGDYTEAPVTDYEGGGDYTDPTDYEPTDAVEPLTTAEPVDGTAPETYGTPPPAPPAPYRRRAALKKVRWDKVRVQDVSLKFDRNCLDRHRHCGYWAGLKKGDKNPETGRRFDGPLCKLNPFLTTMNGCPKACNVCTNSRREWSQRRRLAKAKLRRRNAARRAAAKRL